jgi:hypothetical protein
MCSVSAAGGGCVLAGTGARRPARLEQGLHEGTLRTRAHEALVGLVAEEETDGLGEQRLASAGLAGDDVEAWGESEPRLGDKDEVVDDELGEHGQSA